MLILAVAAMLWFRPELVEQYLLRCPWWGVLALLAATSLIVWRFYLKLIGLCRERLAAGLPVLFSIFDFQRANLEAASRKADVFRDPDQLLMRKVRYSRDRHTGLHGRGVLWTDARVLESAAAIAGGGLLHVSVRRFLRYMGGQKVVEPRPVPGDDDLSPAQPRAHINGLFRGVAIDFFQLIPIAIAIELDLLHNPTPDGGDASLLYAVGVAICVLSAFAFCYAVVMWLLMVRSIVGLLVVGFGVHLVAATSSLVIIVMGSKLMLKPIYPFLLVGVVLSAIAGPAILFARRRYLRLEWARFL